MNKNIVIAVAKRDLRSWFGNPTGYIFIVLFVALSTLALMWSRDFFVNNLANLDTWNYWFPPLAAIFVAASTMGVWTSERSNGTQELLFTLPARDFDLLLGKYLAYAGVYTISLVFTLALPITLAMLGNPDWGQMFANYIGYWLLGLMLVSVSMLGSQLTTNQAVAFILSCLFCAAVIYLGTVLDWAGFGSWATNGTEGQFREFARGMLPASGLVLFLGLTATFFYFNLALLRRRHWRGNVEGMHGGLQAFALAVGTMSLTIIGVHKLPRVDVTVERIHSLGEESKKLLTQLDPQRPVVIKAYVSEDVPELLVQQRRVLLNLVDQFDAIGGDALQASVVIPKPFSAEARDAEENYGIRAQVVPDMRPGGGYTEMRVFLGLVVTCGTEEVITPFVEPGLPLEYEITRSIRVVSRVGERRKVGILKTDVDMVGGFDFQTFAQKPKWQIATELEQQYRVENVDADKDYPTDLDCLIVPQPNTLEQEQMDRLQQYIAAGNATLLIEDPMPMSPEVAGTAADDQKGSMQQRMMGGGGPQKGNIDGLLASVGVRLRKTDVVWDNSATGLFGGQLPRYILFATGNALSQDSEITQGMQSMILLGAGALEALERPGLKVAPLVSSVTAPGTRSKNGLVPKYESAPNRRDGLLAWSPFGSPQPNPGAVYREANKRYDIAMRVTGESSGEKKGVNAIVLADIDAIGNQFFAIRRQSSDANLRFDNVPFVLNCVDHLVGDSSLIELRKRRPILRRLTVVENAQSTFEAAWTSEKNKAEEEAQKALEAAQARLDEAVAKIQNDPSLDDESKARLISERQQAENRKLDAEKAKIESEKQRKIGIAQHNRELHRESIHNGYRAWALLLSIVPASLLGIVTLLRRGARARAIVPVSRQVGGVK